MKMSYLRNILIILGFIGSSMANAEDPKIIRDINPSAEWIAKALSSSGYKADFSLNSLKEIDRFFEEQAPLGKPKSNGLLSENLGNKLFSIGCYIGEVIRRKVGGKWQGNDSDPQAEINISLKLPNGTLIWPVQRVMKRFKTGSEEGIYVYGFVSIPP